MDCLRINSKQGLLAGMIEIGIFLHGCEAGGFKREIGQGAQTRSV